MDDGFDILSVNVCISASSHTEVITMKKMIGLLLIICFVGCGHATYTSKKLRYQERYENGQIKSEGNLKDGIKDGKWVEYYESGKLRSVGKYKAIRPFIIENGYIDWNIKEGSFESVKTGKWVYYYENGQIKSEGKYKDGKKDGKWVGYDEAGNAVDEDIYENDVCVEMCEGDE